MRKASSRSVRHLQGGTVIEKPKPGRLSLWTRLAGRIPEKISSASRSGQLTLASITEQDDATHGEIALVIPRHGHIYSVTSNGYIFQQSSN